MDWNGVDEASLASLFKICSAEKWWKWSDIKNEKESISLEAAKRTQDPQGGTLLKAPEAKEYKDPGRIQDELHNVITSLVPEPTCPRLTGTGCKTKQ